MIWLLILASASSSSAMRALDPLTMLIAGDLAVDPHAVTRISVVYALAFCACQPVLGLLGDAFGKERVLRFCLGLLTLSLLAGIFAQSLPQLMVARAFSGIGSGGIIPLILAITGDRFPAEERGVALSRVVAGAATGSLLGGVMGGILGELMGWRWVLALGFLLVGLVALLIRRQLPDRKPAGTGRLSFRQILPDYRVILSNRLAQICYLGVFVEGLCVFGVMPFVALLFAHGSAVEAGLIVSGMACGSVLYAALAPRLLARVSRGVILRIGGVLAGCGLAVQGIITIWPLAMAGMFLLGIGFSAMHNALQTTVTGLLPHLRGLVVSSHSLSFFLGQAMGPLVFGIGLAAFGGTTALALLGLTLAATGFTLARLMPGSEAADPPAA